MKRILVMDDSSIFLDATRIALEAAGFAVVCVSDLAQLARARAVGAFDLVLMDVQMPEAFGDDVAMTLRESYGISARSYFVSSLDERDLAERVEWSGIDGYISKSVGLAGIVSRVVAILEEPRP